MQEKLLVLEAVVAQEVVLLLLLCWRQMVLEMVLVLEADLAHRLDLAHLPRTKASLVRLRPMQILRGLVLWELHRSTKGSRV